MNEKELTYEELMDKLMEARRWAVKMRNESNRWKRLAILWRHIAWVYYKAAGAPGIFDMLEEENKK